jgi:hypothetical protein
VKSRTSKPLRRHTQHDLDRIPEQRSREDELSGSIGGFPHGGGCSAVEREDQPPRGPVRAPLHERSCSPPGHLEGSGRRGRGLLVGGMWHLRMRLAGSALRRGERRVTTYPLPQIERWRADQRERFERELERLRCGARRSLRSEGPLTPRCFTPPTL